MPDTPILVFQYVRDTCNSVEKAYQPFIVVEHRVTLVFAISCRLLTGCLLRVLIAIFILISFPCAADLYARVLFGGYRNVDGVFFCQTVDQMLDGDGFAVTCLARLLVLAPLLEGQLA